MKEIVIFGDSLTGGRYGIWYGRYLKHKALMRGIDGQYMSEILIRAKRFCKTHQDCIIVLEGGANDIILGNCSKSVFYSWEEDLSDLAKMCFCLFVCTITPIGEDPKSTYNQTRNAINDDIRFHAQSCGYKVADIAQPLQAMMSGRALETSPLDLMFDDRTRLASSDAEKTSMEISASRGFNITTDGVHMNKVGAESVAKSLDLSLQTVTQNPLQ